MSSAVRIDTSVNNAGGVPSAQQGADANKPSSAPNGALYFADDTNIIYYYNGSAWVVLVNGSDTGAYIRNSSTSQNPGVYNIVGMGTITAGSTDPSTNQYAQYLYNTLAWIASSPAAGSLFTAMSGFNNNTFSASYTLPNSATVAASFYRLILTGLANATITIANAGGKKRAMAAQVANVYLPATTFTDLVTDVAGLLLQSVYHDAGTTKSVTMTNYYALLIQQVDEQLKYAAIANKYAIWQDGANDKNVFNGLMQFANANIIASAGAANYFLQPDASGNITSVAAYTSGSLATYAGTVTWTGTTAPSGTPSLSYRWSQTGNLVTLQISLFYSVAGVAITSVQATMPSGLPAQSQPTGTPTNTGQPVGTGTFYTYITAGGFQSVGTSVLRYDGKLQATFSSIAILGVQFQLQYYTS